MQANGYVHVAGFTIRMMVVKAVKAMEDKKQMIETPIRIGAIEKLLLI